MLSVLMFVALVPATLIAGSYVAVIAAVDPGLRTFDAATYIAVRRSLNRFVPRFGRTLTLATVAAAVAGTATAAFDGEPTVTALTAAAAASAAIVMGFSVLAEVPISTAVAAWHPDAPPEDWQGTRNLLGRLNIVRGCAALATVTLLSTAATLC